MSFNPEVWTPEFAKALKEKFSPSPAQERVCSKCGVWVYYDNGDATFHCLCSGYQWEWRDIEPLKPVIAPPKPAEIFLPWRVEEHDVQYAVIIDAQEMQVAEGDPVSLRHAVRAVNILDVKDNMRVILNANPAQIERYADDPIYQCDPDKVDFSELSREGIESVCRHYLRRFYQIERELEDAKRQVSLRHTVEAVNAANVPPDPKEMMLEKMALDQRLVWAVHPKADTRIHYQQFTEAIMVCEVVVPTFPEAIVLGQCGWNKFNSDQEFEAKAEAWADAARKVGQ